MFEVEQKYRNRNPEALRARLREIGATFVGEERESDHYFNAPDRDFATTGEAFRLRRVGESNRLTYKGPKQANSTVKVRTEIEVDVANGDTGAAAMMAMLAGLGYREVAVVRKVRQTFTVGDDDEHITICVDDCEDVGHFVELEQLAHESNRYQAVAAIESLASRLQLTEPESRSYLRMLLEAKS